MIAIGCLVPLILVVAGVLLGHVFGGPSGVIWGGGIGIAAGALLGVAFLVFARRMKDGD